MSSWNNVKGDLTIWRRGSWRINATEELSDFTPESTKGVVAGEGGCESRIAQSEELSCQRCVA
jgi:hypothetical protein